MRCDIYIRQVLRNPRDRAVKITVNEQLVDFVMKLGSTGQAYFVEGDRRTASGGRDDVADPVPALAALASARGLG
jgi:phosphatidate phosphatase PAH1